MDPKKFYLLFLLAVFLTFSCKKDDPPALLPSSALPTPSTIEATSTTTLSSASTLTSVKAISGKSYVIGSLTKGSTYYIDRTNLLTSVPDSLSGLSLIKTANDDKANLSTSFLTFTLTATSTVYVGYDKRGTTLPSWLSGWKKLSATVGTNDTKLGSFVLYSKTFNAGTVTLGGTMANPAKGALCQYIVFAKAGGTASSTTSPMIFGINGHSISSPPYTAVGIDGQITLLKQMDMTYYRQDINFNSDGSIESLNSFIPIYNATKAAGITILPMVYTSTLDLNKSESVNYSAGKTKGTALAAKNSKYFKYYELGNELDNKVILSGNGDKNSNYDITKFNRVAAYLKGLNDGIKASQPTAETMIDASWLHFAYMQMLIDYGVKFDIVAWHWYSEMESIAPSNTLKVTDISVKLASLFSKPIWFTEVGQRYKAVSNIEQLQNDFIMSFTKKVKANPRVRALLLYELFDEPFKAPNLLEANYGFIKWTTQYTKWKAKMVVGNLTVN